MEPSPHKTEFERLMTKKKSCGLVDLKFNTRNATILTHEEFYRQSNAFDAAIARGDIKEHNFGDGTR